MKLPILMMILLCDHFSFLQNHRLVALGTSTTAGLATSTPDSSWVRRFNYYYKYQLGVVDSSYNLGVSGKNIYNGMPSTYTPPAGRPAPDPLYNVSQANMLLSAMSSPANGVVIINFPTGGYDTYSIAEVMSALQIMYDSAVSNGNRCFVTTTQPRTDGGFNSSAVKRKLAILKTPSLIVSAWPAPLISGMGCMTLPTRQFSVPIQQEIMCISIMRATGYYLNV